MKLFKQGIWAVLAALFITTISWAQYPFGASDTTYGLRSRIAENPGFTYFPSPADWRDVNMYQIFTDRFADGDPNNNTTSALGMNRSGWFVGSRTDSEARNFHHGGDWKGLKDNIPYLKGMGINAVWMSGVQMNAQGKDTRFTPYHMYHPTDFFKVDPTMGTFQELKDLIDALHANGIYVILDVVINHTADKNGLWGNNQNDDKQYWGGGNGTFGWWNSSDRHAPPFDDLQYFNNNGTINNWDSYPEYIFGQFKGTDDLKTSRQDVKDWLDLAFKNLIDATDCDGFRVDAIKHVEEPWIMQWADNMRKHAASRGKNDFILFGEYFTYDNGTLARYCQQAGYSFNSALFFPMSQTFKSVFVDGGGSGQLTSQLNNRNQYGEGANRLVTFIDNHDVNRIGLQAGGNVGHIEWIMPPALTFLYTATPVPCLFYGTEHAFQQGGHFNGQNSAPNYDDADWQRENMFDRGFQPGPAQGNKLAATNAPLYQHIARLNKARADHISLRRGSFQERWQSGGRGPYAFSRVYDQEEALVAFNTSDNTESLASGVSVGKPNGTVFVNALNTNETVTVSGGTISFSLPGKGTKIFVAGVAAPQLWVRATSSYPAQGDATADTDIYINTEAGPSNDVTEVVVGYSPDNGVTWTSATMNVNSSWSSVGGRWYNINLGKFAAGATLKYYIEARSATTNRYDNNNSLNYSLTIGEGEPADLWVRGTKNWPLDGAATSADDVYIDAEAGPLASVTQVSVSYSVEPGPTTTVVMAVNPGWGSQGGRWYNVNIGKFTGGDTVRYQVHATDGTNTASSSLSQFSVQEALLAITNPPSGVLVGFGVTNATIAGTAAESVEGPLKWTNALTGASGEFAKTDSWSIPSVALNVGDNVITVSGRVPGGGGLGDLVASDAGANYGAGWTEGSNQGTGFGAWDFNHTQDGTTHWAGVFIGDPAAAGISGMNATSFGFYANPSNSAANAEVIRDFTAPMATGSVFSLDLGLNWDSNNPNSYRGMSLLAGATELVYINMGNTSVININGNTMFANYGNQAMAIRFEYLASGSIRVWGIGRDGSEVYDQTLTVSNGAPSRIKLYFNSTDSEADERQMYVNNFAINAPGSGLTPISTSVTITRDEPGDEDSNGDGVPDYWYALFGRNPNSPNQGSQMAPNGFTYWESFMMNLNPDSTDVPPFAVHMMGAGGFMFSAPEGGRDYVLQHATNLMSGFADVEGVDPGAMIPMGADGSGFYRIRFVDGSGQGGLQSVSVSATPGNSTFTNAAGISVTLGVSGVNVIKSTYSVNYGAASNYLNGDIITLGGSLTNGQSVTLTLYGETANGTQANATYGYTFVDRTTTQVLTSVGGTHHWVSDDNQVFINSAGYPEGSTVSAGIIYCVNGGCTGDWPVVIMSRNADWENGDWWNKDLGILNDGDTVEFAIVMSDAFNNEVWDNNGGANYSVTIGGGGGSVTNGPNTPYSTNPTFGRRGTKTIDGSPADWSDADLIALDKANDDPRSLGNNWTMHEAPIDLTHMWANWDDDYLYIAWQYVDVTDVLDPSNAGGAGGGKISNNDGILQWIVIDTIAGQGATSDMWGKFNSWTGPNKPNYQIYLAGSLWQGFISRAVNGVFPVDDGGVNYNTVAAAGITVAKGNTFGGSSLLGHGDADERTGTNMRNFLNEGHNTARDSFYEMRIPLSYIGVTAATLDATGIGGVMIGAGSTSSMDSIPHDETTLNAQGVETWNSSLEWGDVDIFTSPFARIGGGN